MASQSTEYELLPPPASASSDGEYDYLPPSPVSAGEYDLLPPPKLSPAMSNEYELLPPPTASFRPERMGQVAPGADGLTGAALSFIKGAGTGTVDALAGLPKTSAYALDAMALPVTAPVTYLANKMGADRSYFPAAQAVEPINQPIQQAARELKIGVEGVAPTAPTLVNKVAGAAGNMAPLVAAGIANPILGGATGFSQAMSNTSQDIQQARANGQAVSPNQQGFAEFGTGLINAGDAVIPMKVGGAIAGKVMEKGGSKVLGGLIGAAATAPEEAIQEGLQTLGENVVAGQTYDPNRPAMQGVGESALIGGILGPVLGGVGAYQEAIQEHNQARPQTQSPAPQQEIIPQTTQEPPAPAIAPQTPADVWQLSTDRPVVKPPAPAPDPRPPMPGQLPEGPLPQPQAPAPVISKPQAEPANQTQRQSAPLRNVGEASMSDLVSLAKRFDINPNQPRWRLVEDLRSIEHTQRSEQRKESDWSLLDEITPPETSNVAAQPEQRPNQSVSENRPAQSAIPTDSAVGTSVKEPWQMTWGDYLSEKSKAYGIGSEARRSRLADLREMHRAGIEQALKDGKLVPPEVLADYPDLQKGAPDVKEEGKPQAQVLNEGGGETSAPAKVETIAGKLDLDEFEAKGYAPEQVTRADWVNLQRAYRRSIGQSEESGTKFSPFSDYEQYHEDAVKRAIAKGEEVDPEVLRDYPDLTKKQDAAPAVDDFLSGVSPQEAGKLRKRLNIVREFREDDGTTLKGTIASSIEAKVAKGWRVVLTADGPAFVGDDMQGWSKRDIGDAGMQYANFLLSAKGSTPPAPTVSVRPVREKGSDNWLESLEPQEKQAALTELKSVFEKSEREWQAARDLAPTGGRTAVGSADFDHVLKGSIYDEFRRAISNGSTPEQAEQAAIAAGRDAVAKHNAKRKDINWSRDEKSGDHYAAILRRNFDDIAKTKQTDVASKGPAPDEITIAEELKSSIDKQVGNETKVGRKVIVARGIIEGESPATQKLLLQHIANNYPDVFEFLKNNPGMRLDRDSIKSVTEGNTPSVSTSIPKTLETGKSTGIPSRKPINEVGFGEDTTKAHRDAQRKKLEKEYKKKSGIAREMSRKYNEREEAIKADPANQKIVNEKLKGLRGRARDQAEYEAWRQILNDDKSYISLRDKAHKYRNEEVSPLDDQIAELNKLDTGKAPSPEAIDALKSELRGYDWWEVQRYVDQRQKRSEELNPKDPKDDAETIRVEAELEAAREVLNEKVDKQQNDFNEAMSRPGEVLAKEGKPPQLRYDYEGQAGKRANAMEKSGKIPEGIEAPEANKLSKRGEVPPDHTTKVIGDPADLPDAVRSSYFRNGWKELKNGLGRLKQFVRTVPEFALDPNFTVTKDLQLRFKDGGTYTFNPDAIGVVIHGELPEGTRIGVDVDTIKKMKSGQVLVLDRSDTTPTETKPTTPSGNADAIIPTTGTFAPPRLTERKSATVTALPSELKPVAQPELFQFAKDLMSGNAPEAAAKLRGAYGMFKSVEGMPSLAKIVLNAKELGPDPLQTVATLSHEIGHLVDYLPDATLKRGNMLGRLATLTRYLKNTLPGLEVTNKELRKELVDLSVWWRPVDLATADPEYVKYRKSGKEIYADAVSVLLTSPGDLKERAPKFFKAFIDLIDNKPAVRDKYFELMHELNGDSQELARTRQANIVGMFGTSQEQWDATYARQLESKQSLVSAMFQTLVDKASPLLRAEKKALKGINPWDEQRAAKHAMEEFALRSAEYANFADDVKRTVEEPLAAAGVDMDTAGSLMFLQRIAEGDRGGAGEAAQKQLMELTETDSPQAAMEKAKRWQAEGMMGSAMEELEALMDQAMSGKLNPLGYDPESARQQIEGIKKELGETKYAAAVDGLKTLRKLHTKLVQRAVREGVYNKGTYETTIKPNEEFYAPFAVAKYLGTQVKAGVFKQVGTFNDIANPMHAMMMKSLSLIRATELNRAKRISRESLNKYEPGSFTDLGMIDKNNPRPRVPEGKELFIELENGKPHAYATDPYIAKMYQSQDIGALSRFARVANTATYRVFHPLWIGLNPAFQVFNIPRDMLRTFINAAALHGDEGWAKQVASVFTDVKDVAKAYANPKNIRAAWNKARGNFDPLIRKLNEERALPPSHARATSSEVLEADQFDRFLQQSGVWNAPESKSRILRTIGHLVEPIQTFGNFIETLPKLAMYDMATKAGLAGKERSYIVRNLAGTPNTLKRGLATELSNVVLPYSNVVLQGYRADAEVALNPKTAAGRAMRAAMTSYIPKLAMAAAAGGLFGDELKELFDEISEYDKSKYIVIPLGWSTDDSGNRKASYLRLPHNDTDRLPSAILWKLLTGEKMSGVSESFGIATGELPSWNPWAQIASKWGTFAGGGNPRDEFRGRDIIGKDEFAVGRLPAIKQMLYWTAGNFGAPGDMVRAIATMGNDDQGLPTTTSEKIIKLVPGLNRMVKVSARGEIEKQRKIIDEEDESNAEVRLALPRVAKVASSTLYRLNRLGDENLSAEDQAKRDKFQGWARMYRDAVKSMKVVQDLATSGKIDEAEKEKRWKNISELLEKETRNRVGDGR